MLPKYTKDALIWSILYVQIYTFLYQTERKRLFPRHINKVCVRNFPRYYVRRAKIYPQKCRQTRFTDFGLVGGRKITKQTSISTRKIFLENFFGHGKRLKTRNISAKETPNTPGKSKFFYYEICKNSRSGLAWLLSGGKHCSVPTANKNIKQKEVNLWNR